MNSYTKAKVWDQVYSTMVNLPSGIASAASSLNALHQGDINRDLENRYEEYQAVVDYADRNSVNPAYKSREGFIQAASASTGIDRKFIGNILDSVNWDPTRTNNSTLTDWMVQNGYGTNSWKRNYITKKTAENSRSQIVDTLKQGISDFAEKNMLEGPYTFFDNERKMRYQLRKLSDTAKIAEITGIPKDYVDNLISSDPTIMEEVNEWFDGEFTDKLRDYETQQQSANIATQTQSILDVHVLQCINNNTSDTEFAQGVLNIINRTGYSAAFDKGMKDRMIASSIASYLSQYAVDFAKTNCMLSDSQFFSKYESDITAKRDSIVKAFGDYGITDDMISYADSAIYKALGTAYKTKNEELEDSAEAYTKAQADKIKSDLEYASTELKNRLSTADYDISNGKAYKYSSMSIDDFIKEVSNETFQSKNDLLAWCNKNRKNDIYKSFLELHTNAISKHESEKQEEISATANGIKLNGVKKADELIQKINADPNKYATWTNDDIAKSIGFDSYEAYMNDTDPNKQSLFSRINSAIESAKKSVDEEKTNASKEKQSQEDIALSIKADEIVRKINNAPSVYYDKNEDFAAQSIGFDSYEAYKNGNPSKNAVSCFNSIMQAIKSAKNEVSNEDAKIRQETDKARKELRTMYVSEMRNISTSIIENAKSGLIYDPDKLASVLSMEYFSNHQDLIDNSSPEIKTLYIKTLSSMSDNYADFIGIDNNSVVINALKARSENTTGNVNVAYVSFTGPSIESVKGTPDSYNKSKFNLFNDTSEPIADFSLKESEVETGNPFERTYDWIDKDYKLEDDEEVSDKIYDIDAFISYVDSVYPNMKNNTKFMKALVTQWNKAYCSIPTADKTKKASREALEAQAYSELISTGDINTAQKILSSGYNLYDSPKDYSDAYEKLKLTQSGDVKNAVSAVETMAKSMIPKESTYSSYRNAWTNIPFANIQKLQSDIMRNPDKRESIISEFIDNSINIITSKMADDYYKELKSVGSLYAGFGGNNSESIENGPQLFSMMVDDRFYVGKPDSNTFSVLLASMKNDPNKNIYDVATSIVFEGSEKFDKLDDNQKSIIHSMVSPVAYAYSKMSFMSENAEKLLGVNPENIKYVVMNNDISLIDTLNGNIYSIPFNSASSSWTVCRPTYSELQNIKKSSDSLYVVKETDGATYGNLNLDEIKKLLVNNNISFPNNGFGYAKLN